MADKNRQAGGKNLIPAQVLVCLIAAVVPCQAASGSDNFAPISYVGSADPNMVWEMLLAGIVICSFLTAIVVWIHSALRKVKRSEMRRNAFVSSALNNLNQGVVMTNAQRRVVFCNDRFLEIYGLTRADITADMTSDDLIELRRQRGLANVKLAEFVALARRPEGFITELPGGRSVISRIFRLPNGG